jgi:tripartite-type tricarboxylate transporter receptor subunit TctC
MAKSTAVACIALTATAAASLDLSAQEFTAKSVTLSVGYGAGGGYDTYARVFARHFGKHLPGNPSVVVQNEPGGGGLKLANTIANVGAKEGSQIALISSSAAMQPTYGNKNAKFETSKLKWIGNLNKDVSSCAMWRTSGIESWADAIKKGAKFGGAGPAATTSQHALFLKNVLNAPFTVITGFRGTNDVNLAMQRGEVDGSCGLFVSSVKGPYRQDIESGNLKVIIQFGKQDEPFFKGATNIFSLLKSEEDRKLAEFVFGLDEMSRPLAVAPGTPDAILDVLRTAFDKTVREPALMADAEKARISIDPVSGDATARRFAEFASAPKALIARASEVVTAK